MAMRGTSNGLVQRRTVNSATTSSTGQTSARFSDEDNGEASGLSPDVDADSKETRLTLMEEVLLLGLKDKEVCLLFFSFL